METSLMPMVVHRICRDGDRSRVVSMTLKYRPPLPMREWTEKERRAAGWFYQIRWNQDLETFLYSTSICESNGILLGWTDSDSDSVIVSHLTGKGTDVMRWDAGRPVGKVRLYRSLLEVMNHLDGTDRLADPPNPRPSVIRVLDRDPGPTYVDPLKLDPRWDFVGTYEAMERALPRLKWAAWQMHNGGADRWYESLHLQAESPIETPIESQAE